MGCGGSTQKPQTDKASPKKSGRDEGLEADAAAGVGNKKEDGALADNRQDGSDVAADAASGREKHFRYPLQKEVKAEGGRLFLFSMFGDLAAPLTGLTIATRDENGVVHAVQWTDAMIAQQQKSKKIEKLTPAAFWRALASSMGKTGDVKVSKDGSKVEISLRSKSSASTTLAVELQKQGSDWSHTFRYFAQPFVKCHQAKTAKLVDLEPEVKAKLLKKEASFTAAEAAALTFDISLRSLQATLAPFEREARAARGRVEKMESKITQMTRQLSQIQEGGLTSLDKLYAAPEPTDAVDPEMLPMDGWDRWNYDAKPLYGTKLVHVAWTLFQHYNLVDHFSLNPRQFKNFWCAVEKQYRENAFHNSSRAIEVMITTHCIISTLGFGKFPGKEDGKVTLSPEDLLAVLIAAGIIDLDHRGLDNSCLVKGKEFLSTFYSDLFVLEQNRLTATFELLENEHLNLLAPLEAELKKDVRDTLVEILYMKANAKMQTMAEKLVDFKEKLSQGINASDWAKKDDVRLALTMALRIADVSIWAKDKEIHTTRLEKLVEEFYVQGDVEVSRGFTCSAFMDSCWTADRTRHTIDFPKGQVQIIETAVAPLLETMQQILPEFAAVAACAEENRRYWVSQNDMTSSQQGHTRSTLQKTLAELPKLVGETADGSALLIALASPDTSSIYLCGATEAEVYFSGYDEEQLTALGGSPSDIIDGIAEDMAAAPNLAPTDDGRLALDLGGKKLTLEKGSAAHVTFLLKASQSFIRLRGYSKEKDVDAEVEEAQKHAQKLKPTLVQLEDELRVCRYCIEFCKEREGKLRQEVVRLESDLGEVGGSVAGEDIVACVRNPLAAPLPVGVTRVPDCRDIDQEMFKIVKSKWDPWVEGEQYDPDTHLFANAIRPYTTSEFAQVTETLRDDKRQQIWTLINNIDEWDFDVFALQKCMSGSYTHEGLANQPNGGSLFITCYALFYKYGFMRKFNMCEKTVINWLSMVEAGYHPNPYHNSMHAADVLHVSHYILKRGELIEKCKASDENVFCTLFAACVHDYNHPGINNAFHVKTQNYLAILWNDRSVNENIHASSVFELMRLDRFNILAGFDPAKKNELREMIVELVLGTDMGLHAQILSRFKKKLEGNPRDDVKLALTMAVKMADISNCGRPQKLYHGWCHQIVDEFYMQGDRERLMGLAVSPFMDRYTTVISKGQTAFMNYIVVPLFECMGEFLPKMQHATELIEQNKYFWQEHEDY